MSFSLSNTACAAASDFDLCQFQPSFLENFDRFSVSAWGEGGSSWIAHTPWRGDFGAAIFADPTPDFPFRVEADHLRIEARRAADGRWMSGLLASVDPAGRGFAQRYGYFEIKARLGAGAGLWPAFWLVSAGPAGLPEPAVEIDVFEAYGSDPSHFHSTLHVWYQTQPRLNRAEEHVTAVPPTALSESFHTYGADVEPDRITIYFDRRPVWQVATPAEHTKPLMVLLDLALQAGKPPGPGEMDVAYVHVYRRLPPNPNCAASVH